MLSEKDELSGICFCLLELFIAVINCLSIHKLAKVLMKYLLDDHDQENLEKWKELFE